MREILFRGKRIDNGEWVQGYLTQYSGTIQNGKTFIDSFIQTSHYDHGELVKTDTIVQYTGLTDKNGKKIFEGDIVRTHLGNVYEFAFIERYSRFALRGKGTALGWSNPKLCEVIGNIHDNPELLEDNL